MMTFIPFITNYFQTIIDISPLSLTATPFFIRRFANSFSETSDGAGRENWLRRWENAFAETPAKYKSD